MNPIYARYADRKVPRYTSYPTAPHFHDRVGPAEAETWMAALPEGGSLSLYLHVPFCDSMCNYCGCHTKITKRYQPIASYAQHLAMEMDNVAQRMPGRMKVRHLAWGGGTPTSLEPDDFVMLMDKIRTLFDITPDAELAIEGDPRTVDAACVDMLVRGGINRVSFGVQDFNPHVQEAIGRPQSYELTAEATRMLREAGIEGINYDLMYGLPLQSVDDVIYSMEMTSRIRPERIADLPGQEARFTQTEAAAAELVRLGYVRIGLDHFALPEDEMAIALKAGRLRRNFQGYTTDVADGMIPFGASSIGLLPQGYIQNKIDIGGWKRCAADGELAIAKGFAFSPEDLLRKEIIDSIMCYLSVDLEAVLERHGYDADLMASELAEIDALARDGLVQRDGLKITVPEHNRSFVRIPASVFDTYLKSAEKKHSVAV
ncbi:MAG: coproporphyrinogen III oxidase [Hyphomicrobiales bacterium]|nr:MAG: coproporphyrinogen III oxidase [Hyphomicrobiales bacterium]